MFIYWMGECDVVDSNKERKIEYDKSNLFLLDKNDSFFSLIRCTQCTSFAC